MQLIHPSRTMGARYNLQSTSLNTASQGELYWGRGGNRRLSYVLDLSDLSRRSSTNYEGKVKVGLMSRAVQLSGAVSRSPVSRQMDATFHWDADRDENKNVAIKTRWTSGDKNKADVTLSLPAINQVTMRGGCGVRGVGVSQGGLGGGGTEVFSLDLIKQGLNLLFFFFFFFFSFLFSFWFYSSCLLLSLTMRKYRVYNVA